MLTDLKGEIDSNTVMVGDFNTALSIRHGYPDRKINKEIAKLNCTVDQEDLTDVYRTFHSIAAKNSFFSRTHRPSPG